MVALAGALSIYMGSAAGTGIALIVPRLMKLHVFSFILATCLSTHAWGSSIAAGHLLCEAEAGATAGRVMVSFISQALDENPALIESVSRLANGEEWFNPLTAGGRNHKNIFYRKGVSRTMKLVRDYEISSVRHALREMLARRSGQAVDVAVAREKTRQVLAPVLLNLLDPGRVGAVRVQHAQLGEWQGRPVMMATFEDLTGNGRIQTLTPWKFIFFDPFNSDPNERMKDMPFQKQAMAGNSMGIFKRNGKTYAAVFDKNLVLDLEMWKPTDLAKIGLGNLRLWDGPFREKYRGVSVHNIGGRDILWVRREDKSYAYDLGSETVQPQWEIPDQVQSLKIKKISGRDFLIAQYKLTSGKILVRDLTTGSVDFTYVEKEENVGTEQFDLIADQGRVYLVLKQVRDWHLREVNRVDVLTGVETAKSMTTQFTFNMELYFDRDTPFASFASETERYIVNLRTMAREKLKPFGESEKFFHWNQSAYVMSGADIFDMGTRSRVTSLRTEPEQMVELLIPFEYAGEAYQFVFFRHELPMVMQLSRSEE